METVVPWLRILNRNVTQCKYCATENNFVSGHELKQIASIDGANFLSIRNNTVSINSTTWGNGVSYVRKHNKGRAYITFQRRQYSLGHYCSLNEAADAGKKADKSNYN